MNRKIAVLFSGGLNDRWNFPRYNNDLGYLHLVLSGRNFDDIIVVYADGRDVCYNGHNIPTISANKTNFLKTLTRLQAILGEDDHFFLFVSNHGDLLPNGEAVINCWGKDLIYQHELSKVLKNIPATKIAIFGQCFGGNILQEEIPKSILISANIKDMPSYVAWNHRDYDEFLYHFTSYYFGRYPNGSPLKSDNTDQSIQSAFHYATLNDYYKIPMVISGKVYHEVPQLKNTNCNASVIYL